MPDDSTPDPDTLADRVAERLLARLEGPLLDVLAERIAGKVVERLDGRVGAVEPGAAVVPGDASSSSFLLHAPATSPSATSATTNRLAPPARRLER